MGVVPATGGVLIGFEYQLTGDPEKMVWTIGASDLGPYELPSDLAASFSAYMTATFHGAADISSGWTFLGVSAAERQADNSYVTGYSSNPLVGTDNNPTVTQNTCFLVTKRTASGGLRGQGRAYVPPYHLGEGWVTAAGVIDASVVSDLQSRFDDFLTDLNAALDPAFLCLWHSAGEPATPITSFVVQNVVATQRRRLRR